MIRRTVSHPLAAALALLAIRSVLAPATAEGQATGTAVKGIFAAYEYYEDAPATRDGIRTLLALDTAELEYVRLAMRDRATQGFALLGRKDSSHWMGLERSRGLQLLRIRDATNEYNARLVVDMVSGRLTVLRGVDYKPFNDTEDATVTAYLAVGYLHRAMAGTEVFPAVLRMPGADVAASGAPGASGATGGAESAAPSAAGAAGGTAAGVDERGYLRLWSSASIAARELFAADRFGNDSVLEPGDFTQAVLSYTDSEGAHELQGKEFEVSVLGRAREPENPLRMEDLENMLASLASRSGGLDLSITPMRTTFYVPSTPPTPSAGSSPAGSLDPAVAAFRYLQGLALLAGDYTVVPEAAMVAPGFTEDDLALYWWARLQWAAMPGALYPALIDSGGKLPWGEFALFATTQLKRASIPCMVLLIRRPGKAQVPYHAVCVYQVGRSWRWMDSGTFGDQSADSWELLPARIYGRDVSFRVVDVAAEWLRSTVDESSGWIVSRAAP